MDWHVWTSLCGRMAGVVFNEINTMPGFTAISMYPMLWEARGISKAQLVGRLLEHGLKRWERARMKKDVLITISGIHMMDDEDSDVEMIVRGDYYYKNGKALYSL